MQACHNGRVAYGVLSILRLDKDDHVREPPQVFECPGDEAAVEQAIQLLNGQVIEVWDCSRRVVRLEPAALSGQTRSQHETLLPVRHPP